MGPPSFIINVPHKLIHEFEIVFSTSVGIDLFDGIDFKLASGHISSVNPLLSSDVENILSSEQLSNFVVRSVLVLLLRDCKQRVLKTVVGM